MSWPAELVERVAAAMYEAPSADGGDLTRWVVWPPPSPLDRVWWVERAVAALDATRGNI